MSWLTTVEVIYPFQEGHFKRLLNHILGYNTSTMTRVNPISNNSMPLVNPRWVKWGKRGVIYGAVIVGVAWIFTKLWESTWIKREMTIKGRPAAIPAKIVIDFTSNDKRPQVGSY